MKRNFFPPLTIIFIVILFLSIHNKNVISSFLYICIFSILFIALNMIAINLSIYFTFPKETREKILGIITSLPKIGNKPKRDIAEIRETKLLKSDPENSDLKISRDNFECHLKNKKDFSSSLTNIKKINEKFTEELWYGLQHGTKKRQHYFRCFYPKDTTRSKHVVDYFKSFNENPIKLSSSALKIMTHFIQNEQHRKKENFYLWDTSYGRPGRKDIKIVIIMESEKLPGEYVLLIRKYSKYYILKSWPKREDSQFFVRISE